MAEKEPEIELPRQHSLVFLGSHISPSLCKKKKGLKAQSPGALPQGATMGLE